MNVIDCCTEKTTSDRLGMPNCRVVNRKWAAFDLATSYTGSSCRPRGKLSNAEPSTSNPQRRRPRSAGSIHAITQKEGSNNPLLEKRRGEWMDSDGFETEFQHRRQDITRRRRAIMGMMPSSTVGPRFVDYQALEDQNRQLKQALNRAEDEMKRSSVTKARLEEEVLRTDRTIDLLLAELEQKSCTRNHQRLVSGARSEGQKYYAVVRGLVRQRSQLLQKLASRERELEAIKRTLESSAIVEMKAAEEEYLLEIKRLRSELARRPGAGDRRIDGELEEIKKGNVDPGRSSRGRENLREPSHSSSRSQSVHRTRYHWRQDRDRCRPVYHGSMGSRQTRAGGGDSRFSGSNDIPSMSTTAPVRETTGSCRAPANAPNADATDCLMPCPVSRDGVGGAEMRKIVKTTHCRTSSSGIIPMHLLEGVAASTNREKLPCRRSSRARAKPRRPPTPEIDTKESTRETMATMNRGRQEKVGRVAPYRAKRIGTNTRGNGDHRIPFATSRLGRGRGCSSWDKSGETSPGRNSENWRVCFENDRDEKVESSNSIGGAPSNAFTVDTDGQEESGERCARDTEDAGRISARSERRMPDSSVLGSDAERASLEACRSMRTDDDDTYGVNNDPHPEIRRRSVPCSAGGQGFQDETRGSTLNGDDGSRSREDDTGGEMKPAVDQFGATQPRSSATYEGAGGAFSDDGARVTHTNGERCRGEEAKTIQRCAPREESSEHSNARECGAERTEAEEPKNAVRHDRAQGGGRRDAGSPGNPAFLSTAGGTSHEPQPLVQSPASEEGKVPDDEDCSNPGYSDEGYSDEGYSDSVSSCKSDVAGSEIGRAWGGEDSSESGGGHSEPGEQRGGRHKT